MINHFVELDTKIEIVSNENDTKKPQFNQIVCNIKQFKFNLLELRKKKIKYSKNDPTSFYPSHNITSSSILPSEDKIQSARYPINYQNRYPINHQNHSPKIQKSKDQR